MQKTTKNVHQTFDFWKQGSDFDDLWGLLIGNRVFNTDCSTSFKKPSTPLVTLICLFRAKAVQRCMVPVVWPQTWFSKFSKRFRKSARIEGSKSSFELTVSDGGCLIIQNLRRTLMCRKQSKMCFKRLTFDNKVPVLMTFEVFWFAFVFSTQIAQQVSKNQARLFWL